MAILACITSCILLLIFSPSHAAKEEVRILNEENWADMMEGEWMVKFHAPWCSACRALEGTWKEFSGWSRELDVIVAEVDVTENPGLSGRFLVMALPTIYHVKDGVFRAYSGMRSKEDFISYIEEKRWTSMDPVPSWKQPDKAHMAALGWFFRMSVVLRTVHQTLQHDYGLPYWASYMIFAAATILIGSLLGLLIVCCIDCYWPAKAIKAPKPKESSKNEVSKDDSAEQVEDSQNESTASEEEDDIEGASSAEESEEIQDSEESHENQEMPEQVDDTEVRKRKVKKDDTDEVGDTF